MPRRLTATKDGTHKALKNTAFESRTISWLMQDGWQLFTPVLDHGHQTDILISDGPNYHRVQVKTIDSKDGEEKEIENKWKDSHVNVVVVFTRNSNWGYVIPAFKEKKRKLNHSEHQRFEQNKTSFLKAFHKL
ncbi:hypothetical protein [Coraliomargarita parva]|uniref:hypothetical protein n=1 Tax=Coraliomargarita parva TaxID=3014050 RepID=UPI0022B44BEF|nr:hypothetical protein [Coraliomargarita parva]